jgi:hypothetical protein
MATTLGVEDMLATKFQPVAKRHFLLAIEGIDSFLVKTASKPTFTTEEVAVNWINTTRYIAGKTTFGTMTVTLHGAIGPSANQQVMEWIRLCYESVSGRGGYADFYKRDIQLKQLDPVGTVIELWDIKGSWITEANFNDVTYEGSDLTEISLTLRYDNAVLQY